MTRAETARRIRDHALAIIGSYGLCEPLGDEKALTWRGARFTVMYWTPLDRRDRTEAALKRAAAQFGLSLEQTGDYLARTGLAIPEPLPYALDIWQGRKVMNLEWADDGALFIVSFRRGPWEGEFLELPTSSVTLLPCHVTLQ